MREQPAAARPSGVAGHQQKEEGPRAQWDLKLRPEALLQSLVSQDLLRFAPLLEAPAIAALGPSGPLTRLQVKDTKKSAEEAAALDFPEPPRSFSLSISSDSATTPQRIQLHRRPAIAAAFLNPKGRVLADSFIVWRDNLAGSPRFLLDVDASVSERVSVYLERHAVSSSFAVSFDESFFALQLLPPIQRALSLQATRPPPVAPDHERDSSEASKDDLVHQSFTFVRCSAGGPSSFRLLDTSNLPHKEAASAEAAAHSAADARAYREGLIVADPRTWRLGYRVYLGPVEQSHEGLPHEASSQHQSASPLAAATGNSALATARAEAAAAQPGVGEKEQQRPLYEAYRRLSGVCEGLSEAGVGEQLPLSLNFDFLGLTCSHNKGCFVGQEVLTRALHQLSNRRRVAVLLKTDLSLSENFAARVSEASPSSGEQVKEKTSLEAWVPCEVIALWERALVAAAARLLECLSAKTSESADAEEDSIKQRVAAGDRLYRKTGAAEGEAGAWREIGHVLAFDEDVACGLCLLRSPPADGPLKSPQDLVSFTAALAGVRLMVCKEKPPKGLVLEGSEPKDEGEGFLVVPPPYVVDALLAAPEAAPPS
ncbi:hypothetical protein Emed_003907 [Eimeria media]